MVREGLSLEVTLDQHPECYLKVWSWLPFVELAGPELGSRRMGGIWLGGRVFQRLVKSLN